jgi:hypothetical protein
LTISPGEGMFQTFQEMGIPQDQWSGIMDRVGDQLVQNGDAYPMGDGTFGWSASGQLSQGSIDLIQNARF